MKKIIFPIIIFFTFLASANVQSRILFTLAIAEIIFAGMMIVLSIYQRSKLRIEPVKSFVYLPRLTEHECRLKVENDSFLPVGRFRLLVSSGYEGEERLDKTYLYGGSDINGGYLKYAVRNPLCGLNHLYIEKIKCYDWLMLSSFTKKSDKVMEIAVLPDSKEHIRFSSPEKLSSEVNVNDTVNSILTASGAEEISDIRPYKSGDPMRRIYWKQSAKMGELWVREYRDDVQCLPVLEIEPARLKGVGLKKADAFYRLLQASLGGMFKLGGAFILRLCDPGGGSRSFLISDPEQFTNIFTGLYKNDFSVLENAMPDGEVKEAFALRLDTDLTLSRDGVVLKQYSEDGLEDEVREEVVICS